MPSGSTSWPSPAMSSRCPTRVGRRWSSGRTATGACHGTSGSRAAPSVPESDAAVQTEPVQGRGFGDLEAVVMERVWSADQEVTVREVFADLVTRREIAYTTVMSTMDNLH